MRPVPRAWRMLAVALLASACTSSAPALTPGASPMPVASSIASPSASPALATGACPPATDSATALGALARNGPDTGAWVGLNLDWGSETVADLASRLGRPPADVVSFVSFPLTA